MGCELHLPRNTGALFSTNARAASLWSSVWPVLIWCRASRSRSSASVPFSAALKFCFISASATRGPRASLRAKLHHHAGEFGIGNDPIDDAQRQALARVKRLCREIEFTRLAGSDEPGEEIASAEVAGKSDFRKCGDEARRLPRDAQIASERQCHAGAGRGAVHHRDRGFRNFVQQPRYFHFGAQTGDVSVRAAHDCLLRHALDVAAGAEGAPAPVSTIAPTAGSAARRGSASSRPSMIGAESALSRSGRLSVSVATPSEMASMRSCSIPRIPPPAW